MSNKVSHTLILLANSLRAVFQLTGADGEHAVLHYLGTEGSASPSKPAVLFTHGNGLNAGMWAVVTPHLQDSFECWGLDFRGHGASRPTRDDFTVNRLLFSQEISQAVEHIRNSQAPSQIFGVGQSLGAACLIMNEIANPGTFAGLWLYEPVLLPIGFESEGPPSTLVEAARRRRVHFDSKQAAFERFFSKPPFSKCDPAAVKAYVDLGCYETPDNNVRLSCLGETEARVYEATGFVDFDTFKQVKCPTVVARGGTPDVANELPPQLAAPTAEALANAEVKTFGPLSHFGPMEDGQAIAAAIREHFLL